MIDFPTSLLGGGEGGCCIAHYVLVPIYPPVPRGEYVGFQYLNPPHGVGRCLSSGVSISPHTVGVYGGVPVYVPGSQNCAREFSSFVMACGGGWGVTCAEAHDWGGSASYGDGGGFLQGPPLIGRGVLWGRGNFGQGFPPYWVWWGGG